MALETPPSISGAVEVPVVCYVVGWEGRVVIVVSYLESILSCLLE